MMKFLVNQVVTNPRFLPVILSWWAMCLDNPFASISIIVVIGVLGLAFYSLQTKRKVALKKLKR